MEIKALACVIALALVGCASVKREPLPTTEIWLADYNERTMEVSNVRLITTTKGYNNQPCFDAESTYLLYASDIDGGGSPDVMRYDIATGTAVRVTNTKAAEFSPTPTHSGRFTAVHVGNPYGDGEEYTNSQELWEYDSTGKALGAVIPQKRIGYHAWLDASHVAVFVVGNDSLGIPHRLDVVNTVSGVTNPIANNIGRCIKRAPNGMLSYVDKSDSTSYSIMVASGDTLAADTIATLPKGTEDFCWTYEGSIFAFANGTIYRCATYEAPRVFKPLTSPYVIGTASRIAMSPNSRFLVWVVKQ